MTATPPKGAKKRGKSSHLSKQTWLRIAEEYRNGAKQADLARAYGVRPETISLGMKRMGVKGGEMIDRATLEIQARVLQLQKDWAEKKVQRSIQVKEGQFNMVRAVQAVYARQFKKVSENSDGTMSEMLVSAKAYKDTMMAMRLSREEMYAILDIKPEVGDGELPELLVGRMAPERVEELRSKGVPVDAFQAAADAALTEADVAAALAEMQDEDLAAAEEADEPISVAAPEMPAEPGEEEESESK